MQRNDPNIKKSGIELRELSPLAEVNVLVLLYNFIYIYIFMFDMKYIKNDSNHYSLKCNSW